MRHSRLIALFVLLLSITCGIAPEIGTKDVFSVNFAERFVKIETLGHYGVFDVAQLLQLAGLQSQTKTTSGFFLYRVTYQTEDFNGDTIPVSGLLAIPDSKIIKGIVSWQHGTNATRAAAPSAPSINEGIPLAALFAGDGYILLAPDYIGLGVSTQIPRYMHTQSTVNTVIDFINIGSTILDYFTLGSIRNLYLIGFSQGGSVTAGVQHRLEVNNPTGLILKGTACIAGAYNLRDISIRYAITNHSVFYLAYIANSYSHIYGGALSSIINDKYVGLVQSLFDGSEDYDRIESALPSSVEELYTQGMLNDITSGALNWFTTALDENETYRWIPHTPLRLYYGESDKDVSPEDSRQAAAYMKSQSGDVCTFSVGPYDHFGSVIAALPYIQQWFDAIR